MNKKPLKSTKDDLDSVKRDSTLEQDAWELYKVLSQLVRVYQFRDRSRICYYDISATQCYAISMLIRLGPISLNRLAAELYLNKSTASRAIASLEQKGYVRRSIDPKDGRARVLEVTEKGWNLHSRIEKDLVNEMKGMVEDFDPHVRQSTALLFSRLTKAAAARFSEKLSACTLEEKQNI